MRRFIMINVALIGAGNVMSYRHIPALKKNKKCFKIRGIIDINEKKARYLSRRYNIQNFCGYKNIEEIKELSWFKESSAIVVAVPPMEHYNVTKFCLQEKKHVFVEKPFVTKIKDGEDLISIAKSNELILCVNENLQYSHNFLKLEKEVKKGMCGKIKSVYCIQTSSRNRILPNWLEDERLPMGLVYDEMPHVLSLLRRFSKDYKLDLKNVYIKKSLKYSQTPQIVNLDFNIDNVPASFYLNFECPICEWFFIVFCTKKVLILDCFKDIFITLPNDGKHLLKDVLRNSSLFFLKYFLGMCKNSFDYIMNNLLYGLDNVYLKFYYAIEKKGDLIGISGIDALYITKIQHEILESLKKEGGINECQK